MGPIMPKLYACAKLADPLEFAFSNESELPQFEPGTLCPSWYPHPLVSFHSGFGVSSILVQKIPCGPFPGQTRHSSNRKIHFQGSLMHIQQN